MRTRTFLVVAVITALLSGAAPAASAEPADRSRDAGPRDAGAPESGAYEAGRYIVVMKDHVSSPRAHADLLGIRHAGRKPDRVFSRALKGFAMSLSSKAAGALARDPDVAYIEPDRPVRASGVQASAPWGLDRLDQRNLPLNAEYSYTSAGAGVTAYVIDTGIRTAHQQFGGRASVGLDVVGDGWNGQDCEGHGTHVAGSIGGSTYGVAKNVSLVSVRVLDCKGSGLDSDVIEGVEWVTANAAHPAVVNMSLGGSRSTALDDAVAASIAAGITYVAAAGNEGVDACNSSPGALDEVVNVSATSSSDARPSWANYGTCVDLFAPGYNITSADAGSDTATAIMSGTSMAAPHVAGVAARYLGENTTATPAEVASAILVSATQDKVTSPGTGTPNLLLHSEQLVPGAGTTLTVSRSGTGQGSVISSPAGLACGSICSAEFETGASVVLSPSPADGSTFGGWGGACSGTGGCTVSMTEARTVTASFKRTVPVLPDLGFEKGPTGGVWQLFDDAAISKTSKRSGAYAADLCGANNCDDAVFQVVEVPAGVQSASLTYSYRGLTNEETADCYDGLIVGAQDADDPVGQTSTHCNDEATGKWRTGSVSLTSYLQAREGDRVTIFAATVTDKAYSTRFFVDNLNLKVATSADTVAPSVGFTGSKPARFQKSLSFPLGWTGSDAASSVASYDVRYRRARHTGSFGSYVPWRHATTLKSATFSARAGYTYCFSVRARDVFGNQSKWSGERCTAFPVNDRALDTRGTWKRASTSTTYLGTYSQASTPGKALTTTVKARRVALIVTTCSTCGKVDVYVGSIRLARVSLYSATTNRKKTIYVDTLSSVRTRTLKIKIVSSGKKVIIEGLGISRI